MLAVALTMAALVLASQQDICGAQLSIHTDSNTNSFSLKAPGLQQTFTRYYGAARPQQQEAEQPQQEQLLVQQQQQQQLLQQQQQQLQQQQQEQLYNQYRLTRLRGSSKPNPAAQQQNQLNLQQQLQQQALLAQSGFGSAAATGASSGVTSYADQMQAAFLDYQRQRLEFEQQQQQQQLQQLQQQQKLYRYYPDVQSQQQQQPAEGLQGANGFVYQRPQFLQAGGSAGSGLQRPVGASDFYAAQQQQDVLREQQQQQLAAQQFATSQVAPTTRPSSAPVAASFQPSSDVSHVSFSSGNLKYSF
ncbi:hypothetical protein KR054_000108 [Drosophila jambulina]|nr:hypothetical protein KR054_000108 [Drosophila jambulina]